MKRKMMATSATKGETLFEGEFKQYAESDGVQISRKQTTIEREVRSRSEAAASLAHELVSPEEMDKHDVSAYMPPVSISCDMSFFTSKVLLDLRREC
jgi:hypothetical protein